ncbi:Type 1 glutamine amidotransferase-like domain-containing protein [Caldibacillus lycopersici]|uniref:Type 1 glutamine amidotransferase-like domain-containing protein n=1 Tax=Perspicuibacillus lycopersici TaxID=1325689 RepID=A0AAE3IWM6_9BACI|nr:Type 1 glutamine amidotransferase-like domain-containing protein [Perspicuibacillus lycopersici]MCU9614751.1 Type 1 glutamine amidotransferase-like domain-containing protein [Perspicuibacillus lycopersici]
MDKHLFLFGSGPPFTIELAYIFHKYCKNGPVSILFVERNGWLDYMTVVTKPLRALGLSEFHYIPLPSIAMETAIQHIEQSSGIIILGGNTNRYADYIVDTELAPVIKKKFRDSVPVAGFSAGALISLQYCILSPNDNDEHEYQQRNGLNLLEDFQIAVHYNQWQDEKHLLEIGRKFPEGKNYGIDEKTGIYVKNGQIKAMEGNGVYKLTNGIISKIH